jgi:hypothetical protein
MDLLDFPQAQELLDDAALSPADLRDCTDPLQSFVQRYLPRFHRIALSEKNHWSP